MTLKKLFTDIDVISVQGDLTRSVQSLTYDSRMVKSGTLFFAIDGLHVDGHQYIDNAIERGAVAIVHTKELSCYDKAVSYIQVENSRYIMSPVSAKYFQHPSRKLKVIGVTGTDGKSSTVWYIQQFLSLLGLKSGFISTVAYSVDGEYQKNHYRQSTPEATEIHAILSQMLENDAEFAVVESTSHGLSEKNNRLGDIDYNVAIMTNLTHEHLEFHGSFEQYCYDKANLFRYTNKNGLCIINADDATSPLFKKASNAPFKTYGYASADFQIHVRHETVSNIDFDIQNDGQSHTCHINLPGRFNCENVTAAIIAVKYVTGAQLSELAQLAEKLVSVRGRMTTIDEGQDFSVLVDYAHSPGSFEKILPIVKRQVQKRLIVLFGSAGERDTQKRPIQGRIADEHADIIFLADEDPRGEDAMTILKDIAAGIHSKKEGESLFLIPDRKKAMQEAFRMAKEGDTVLLLGKGHETSIIYKDQAIPWDEIDVARDLLNMPGVVM